MNTNAQILDQLKTLLEENGYSVTPPPAEKAITDFELELQSVHIDVALENQLSFTYATGSINDDDEAALGVLMAFCASVTADAENEINYFLSMNTSFSKILERLIEQDRSYSKTKEETIRPQERKTFEALRAELVGMIERIDNLTFR